jgi:hypothetical protein
MDNNMRTMQWNIIWAVVTDLFAWIHCLYMMCSNIVQCNWVLHCQEQHLDIQNLRWNHPKYCKYCYLFLWSRIIIQQSSAHRYMTMIWIHAIDFRILLCGTIIIHMKSLWCLNFICAVLWSYHCLWPLENNKKSQDNIGCIYFGNYFCPHIENFMSTIFVCQIFPIYVLQCHNFYRYILFWACFSTNYLQIDQEWLDCHIWKQIIFSVHYMKLPRPIMAVFLCNILWCHIIAAYIFCQICIIYWQIHWCHIRSWRFHPCQKYLVRMMTMMTIQCDGYS